MWSRVDGGQAIGSSGAAARWSRGRPSGPRLYEAVVSLRDGDGARDRGGRHTGWGSAI